MKATSITLPRSLAEKLLESQPTPEVHITGYSPIREVDPTDPEEHAFAYYVVFPWLERTISVYGDGLSETDAIEAAVEWARKNGIEVNDMDEETMFATRT